MKRSISCKEFSSSELRYDSSALSVEDPPYIFLYLTCYFLDFWQLKCSSELPVNSFLVQLVIDINRTYALPLHCSLCQAWQLSSVKSTRWDLLLRKTFKLFNVIVFRASFSWHVFTQTHHRSSIRDEFDGNHQVLSFVIICFYTMDWLYGQFLWSFRHES